MLCVYECVSVNARLCVCMYVWYVHMNTHMHICVCVHVRMCAYATFHRQQFLLGCYGNHSSKNVKLNPTPCGPEKPKERELSGRHIWGPELRYRIMGSARIGQTQTSQNYGPTHDTPMAWSRTSVLLLPISLS